MPTISGSKLLTVQNVDNVQMHSKIDGTLKIFLAVLTSLPACFGFEQTPLINFCTIILIYKQSIGFNLATLPGSPKIIINSSIVNICTDVCTHTSHIFKKRSKMWEYFDFMALKY